MFDRNGMNRFTFQADEMRTHSSGTHTFLVPIGIRDSQELFAAFADALSFPEYFGQNWDALEECLGDLAWIPERTVSIVHGDIPMRMEASQCRIYLSILADVADVQRHALEGRDETSDESSQLAHRYEIVFPSRSRPDLERLAGC